MQLDAGGEIIRGEYGVPHIFAKNAADAFYSAGYAVAQDRIWQMELSRRSARGKLSEILGKQALNSDQDALRFGYTTEEYRELFARLPDFTQKALRNYAAGINAWLSEAQKNGKLPLQFAENKPAEWTAEDSLAIGTTLVRRFGRGGAGEIRNLLLYTYLRDRLKERTLDAVEDIAWQQDAASIPTVADSDDPFRGNSPFPKAVSVLSEHSKLLPKANLLELLPGIRIEQQADMREIAAQLGLPVKWGSYCIVVGKDKSAIGVPLLMNGPQMDFSLPSAIHQMSISSPEYSAVGMDLPGVPGILVGYSPYAAWGITSGVADTDDIFFVKLNPGNAKQYWNGSAYKDFEVLETKIDIKGTDAATGKRELSDFGPVVIKSISTGVAYVRKSSLWKSETDGLGALLEVARAKDIGSIKSLSQRINASLNLFAATTSGDIGWFYCGRVPIRSGSVDPRLPAPADKEHDWKGMVPAERMPYVINPKQGYIANWNNKPVSWWPNLDTPIWGRVFRNEMILRQLAPMKNISTQDLESVVRNIAMNRVEPTYFLGELRSALKSGKWGSTETQAAAYLENWQGNYSDGSVGATIYDAWFDALRESLFQEKLGTFMSPANFRLVAQPTFTWNALHGKTKLDYLASRRPGDVMRAAFSKAVANLALKMGNDAASWLFKASRITWKGLQPVVYADRGTYIQFVELWRNPRGRFVAPPGISEDVNSPYFADQRELAANWDYFPMLWKRSDFP